MNIVYIYGLMQHVPIKFFKKYIGNVKKQVMTMLQFRKTLWPVKLVLHGRGYSVSFSAGWSSFARENKLQPGDVCIFELVNGKNKLPSNFTTKCGDGMSNPVFLKPPDSAEWKIHWIRHDGEIWFEKGWKEFATYYSLGHGHLLLFEYERTSHLDVHIFDNSAVEIDYPSLFTHDNPHQIINDSVQSLDKLVQINDDSVEILREQCCQKTGVKYTVSSAQPCKRMKDSIITTVGGSSNGVNLHQHGQTRRTIFQDKGKDIFHAGFPNMDELTSRALDRATSFKSEHPSFLLVMKPAFINENYLEIPPQFSKQYLKKTHAVILLEVMDGRSWPVICYASRITTGWQKFALENNLNVDDVCVFELIKKIQSVAFKVFIFRSAEEPSGPISQAKHEFCENANIDDSKFSIVHHPSTSSRGGSSSQRTSRVESHLKFNFIIGEGQKEASKFTSENPFFMATLKLHGNTTRCPRVPSIFVRNYVINKHMKVMMLRLGNNLWPVTFVFHQNDASGTLSAGWPLFSRENNLQMGDVCIFELVNREDVTLAVHVFRGHSQIMH
ncbi:unnamed protein product [Sphenostylis stenocarpa]|uniref:TF-B3 domain-containing protein n=1 Tax=Sphenostylis stenocarpa TaxID=92480 RepID=A0AA86S3V2_9FABA|nr:unnamed protein product [Sphenostylis stenocarpa]